MYTTRFMSRRTRIVVSLMTAGAFLASSLVGVTPAAAGDDDAARTASPIKHVIVIIGENRSFDNVYATYVPKPGQHVANLLSKGIVHSDGSPGPNKDLAEQFRVATINPVSYFIDTNTLISPGKTAYAPFLPTPEAGFAPP